jgi:hypothetical protein
LVVTVPGGAMAGNPVNVKVTASNGYNGNVQLTSSDGQLTPLTVQMSGGQLLSPVSITLTKVGTLTIQAVAGSLTGTSNSIDISPAIAKSLWISGQSSIPVPVNEWNQVDLVALDAYGNVATLGGDVTISSSPGGVLLGGPDLTTGATGTAISMTNGKAVVMLQVKQAETVTFNYAISGLTASQTVTFK